MGSIGSSQQSGKTSSGIDPMFKPYVLGALNRGQAASVQGYTPYMGNEVAAFNPTQVGAMQGINDTASVFNGQGPTGANVQASLPKSSYDPTTGITGISSYPGYLQQLSALKSTYPGIWNQLQHEGIINPITGKIDTLNPPAGTVPGSTPPQVDKHGVQLASAASPAGGNLGLGGSIEQMLFGSPAAGGTPAPSGGDSKGGDGRNINDWWNMVFGTPHTSASNEGMDNFWGGYQGSRPGLQFSMGIPSFGQWQGGGSRGGIG